MSQGLKQFSASPSHPFSPMLEDLWIKVYITATDAVRFQDYSLSKRQVGSPSGFLGKPSHSFLILVFLHSLFSEYVPGRFQEHD